MLRHSIFGIMEVTKGGITMLKNLGQMEMELSPYQGLYDAIIPKDHILRRLKENIDFSFVNPMLKKQYCEHFGRPAKEPEMIFKLLFLKKLYDLSDERVISSSQTDMAYKYFLGLAPEDKMIGSQPSYQVPQNQNYGGYPGRIAERNNSAGNQQGAC